MPEEEDSDNSSDNCSSEDRLVYTAAGLIVCGIICMVVGYVIPRDYTFNPYARARDMESIEIYYADLSQKLDLTIVIGMAFIAIGGIMLSSFITYISCCESKSESSLHTERRAISLSGGRNYGTSGVSGAEPRPVRNDIALCER
ncbi:transmembrane protein 74B-like [Saccostrea echinata]|uniref:transmembrane protein 74B-like n=1 Tax=Saccostrea echinata TaxID=191078 RepID=UPI002A813551|nr:transmembrane protein 74B-like [Saccostrea echinata]XP_061197580.1 transmembrane protein 74B-like [Saccostrea echinata]